MYRGLLLTLSMALLLSACQGESKAKDNESEQGNPVEEVQEQMPTEELSAEDQAQKSLLEEIEWTLISYIYDGEERPVQKEGPIVANFRSGKLSGSGGCNTYFTTYKIGAGKKIQVGNIGASKKLCSNIMRQESNYLELLKESSSFSIDQKLLVIKSAKGELAFRPSS